MSSRAGHPGRAAPPERLVVTPGTKKVPEWGSSPKPVRNAQDCSETLRNASLFPCERIAAPPAAPIGQGCSQRRVNVLDALTVRPSSRLAVGPWSVSQRFFVCHACQHTAMDFLYPIAPPPRPAGVRHLPSWLRCTCG